MIVNIRCALSVQNLKAFSRLAEIVEGKRYDSLRIETFTPLTDNQPMLLISANRLGKDEFCMAQPLTTYNSYSENSNEIVIARLLRIFKAEILRPENS